MKKPADFFLKPDHEEDRTYQSDDDKTVNSSDLFSKINHESGLDSPPNDFKTTMSSPTSIGGINAPIGAVRPFKNEEDSTYQSDDDKTVNSSDLFSKINHESGLDSPPNDFKTTMSSPTSIGGINAPIGAVRPFTNLLSPIAKTNSKTCPNFFDNLDSQALSLDLASESNASSSQPTTSPGRNAPLRRRHDPKRRHSI